MIAADIKFHEFLYSLSGNPLIGPAMNTHLTYTQRVMGEVLIQDQEPWDIWAQHANILQAIASGDAALAEKLAIEHLTHASHFMVTRLKAIQAE
jgi:DNA-binding FadR family transcriptional regulator